MRQHIGPPRFLGNATIFMVCVIIVLTVIAAGKLHFRLPLTAEQRLAEKVELAEQQARWDEQRKDREQRKPFDLAVYILVRLAALVLFAGAGAGLISALTLYGWRRAATVSPVGGLYPLIISKLQGQWTVLDPNRTPAATTRLGDGGLLVTPGWEQAQLLVTAGALAVQNTQAQSYSVNQVTNQTAAASAGETAPVMNWPVNVPLSGLLRMQGGASIHSVVWGMTLNDQTGQQEVVKASLDELCHIGIGGSSGWGKSRFVEMILYQLLTAKEPVDVALIDLKREHVGFNRANLLYPVATTPGEAKAIFGELGQELDRRLELMGGALSLDEYNARRNGKPELNRLVLVGDETTALFRTGDKDLVNGIQRIALLGRSAGLLLILAGQNWKVGNSGGSETRDQLSSRCQFKANSPSQSRLLVDCPDAAKLNDPGRAVVILPGRERFVMQGAFIGRDEIERTLAGQNGPSRQAPGVQDVTPEQPVNSITEEQKARIIELADDGATVTGIAKKIWGTTNGRRLRQVRAILDSYDGTTGRQG